MRGKEAKGAETVLDRDDDEALVVRVDDLGHVLDAVSQAVSATVNPYKDRKVLRLGRGIDVEEEAVLITGNGRPGWVNTRALDTLFRRLDNRGIGL